MSKRPIHLSVLEQYVLDSLVLYDTDTATGLELAAKMGVTEHSVDAPLDRLRNKGMVSRRASNLGYVWWPTDKGHRYTKATLAEAS